MAITLYTHIAPRQPEYMLYDRKDGAVMPREARLDLEDCDLDKLPTHLSGNLRVGSALKR